VGKLPALRTASLKLNWRLLAVNRQLPDTTPRQLKTAWHLGLTADFFDNRHERTRSTLKSTELHSFTASPMQAERCSGVGCNSADAAVGNAAITKQRPPIIPLRIFFMTSLLMSDGAPRPIDDAQRYAA